MGLALALQEREIPLHIFFHGSEITNSPWSRWGFEKVCAKATHRWAVSEYLVGVLRAYKVEASRIPIPVDISRLCVDPLPPAPQDWLYVARATELKGGERFLRLIATDPDAVGTVIGDGPALGAWKKLATSLGVGKRVAFRGALPPGEVRAAMEAHDLCLLLPTQRGDGSGAEGLGICLLEGALAGMAVIGCDTGGVSEAVGAGLILENPDDPKASLVQIREWWSAERGAECGRWVVANHGPDATVRVLTGE